MKQPFTLLILNVTFDRVVTMISAGPVPVTAASGGLDFSISGIASGSINLSGTYSITGSSSSVSQPFELDLSLVGRGLGGTLSNINYPNAFDFDTSRLTLGFSSSNPPLIFSETVDGQTFEAGIGLVNFDLRTPVSLNAVPEPSSFLLLLLGGIPVLLRRR